MSQTASEAIRTEKEERASSHFLTRNAKSKLTKLAAWINDRNIPFLVGSIGMIVMLLWAGSFKMTRPGAEGIIPLVSNSPLISWHFKLFGPYVGSDIIGLTEWMAALLIIAGYFKPKAGILGGLIATGMFSITSTMLITTPGAIISIHGLRYMSFLGLFLFKDVISLGVSFYLISYFGEKLSSPKTKANQLKKTATEEAYTCVGTPTYSGEQYLWISKHNRKFTISSSLAAAQARNCWPGPSQGEASALRWWNASMSAEPVRTSHVFLVRM